MPEGFGKAILVCIGKPVCWNEEIGKKFVEDTRMKRMLHEEEVRRRSIELSQHMAEMSEIIDDIICVAVHRCESLIIENVSVEKIKLKRKGNGKKISKNDFRVSSEVIRSVSRGSQRQRGSSKPKSSTTEQKELESKVNISQTKTTNSLKTPKRVSRPEKNIINVTVDCETNMNPLTYFVTFDVIKNVLSLVYWNVSISNIEDKSVFEIAEDIFNECRRCDFNSEVLVHEYLNNSKFLELIKNTSKFLIKNPIEIVKDLVNLQ